MTTKKAEPVPSISDAFQNVKLYSEDIDFLTVKLDDTFPYIDTTLAGCVENSPVINLDFGYTVHFFGFTDNGQRKILLVRKDGLNENILMIRLRQKTDKKNKNMASDVIFYGLFWVAYQDDFDYFCSLFGIRKDKSRLVTRIDYRFDVAGITPGDLFPYYKGLLKRNVKHMVGDYLAGITYKTKRHELGIYDKKLDIMDKKKHTEKILNPYSDGEFINRYIYPYKHYIDQDFSITRIEYRATSEAFYDLYDSSIDSLFKNIRQMASDYFRDFYSLNLEPILDNFKRTVFDIKAGDYFDSDGVLRRDDFNDKIHASKSHMYISRGLSYLDNYALLNSEKKLFEKLYFAYGDRMIKYLVDRHLKQMDRTEQNLAFFQSDLLLSKLRKKCIQKNKMIQITTPVIDPLILS